MANPMTSTKRFSVRLALVTSSTVAMIVGAQTLATLDPVSAAPVADTAAQTTQTTTIPQAAPQITILRHAAPSLTFQAHTGTTTTANRPNVAPAQVAARPTMQPPVAIVVPQSSQMGMPLIPTTRSSR